jgi:hypothetical protein
MKNYHILTQYNINISKSNLKITYVFIFIAITYYLNDVIFIHLLTILISKNMK